MSAASKRHEAFAREYVKEHNGIIHNGTAAYKAVYPNVKKDSVAAAAATRLLSSVKVREMIEKFEAKAGERAEIDVGRLLKESERLAYVDSRKLYNPDGTQKLPHEIDDETAAAIGGIEKVVDGDKVTWKYKVLDKNAALERLFKHKGLFKPASIFPNIPEGGEGTLSVEYEETNLYDSARRIAFALTLAGKKKAG